MKLGEAVQQYIEWRRSYGAKFGGQAVLLNIFLKSIDEETGCDDVTNEQVCAFLKGNRTLTRYRSSKYSALAGFYRFAISRGYANRTPLPDNEPKSPTPAPPYVFSVDELHRLFGAIDVSRRTPLQLDTSTFRVLLLLLYGTGLRRGEALNLTLADVDLSAAVLTVRDTKFYKTRLVPVGPQLAEALREYWALRAERPLPEGDASTFLANLDGTGLHKDTVRHAFVRLLKTAGIDGADDTRRPPTLHSFRHSFAVHRLTSWYRQGADVQRLLPVLSTYLGHSKLAHTQVYLSMTPELLQQASLRFERYVLGENNG